MTVRIFVYGFFFCLTHHSLAQLYLVPIPRSAEPENTSERARLMESTTLPFWDDFSTSVNYPKMSHWADSTVWINADMGIDPPSFKVATFDGLNKEGTPYSVNDLLAKGYADALTSNPIDLSTVQADQKNTVYLSFYYQNRGRGERPDYPDDKLELRFLSSDNSWETVWSVEADDVLTNNQFYFVILPVNDESLPVDDESLPEDDETYFHENFQFRFQNFGRLSGPYDMWHIDYVYLNQGRSSGDKSFPDRAITSPLSPLFSPFHYVPTTHLAKDHSLFSLPQFETYNLRIGNEQPLNYNSSVETTVYQNQTTKKYVETLDVSQDMGTLLGLDRKTTSLVSKPSADPFVGSADSIALTLLIGITTKDNVPISSNGDYSPNLYAPIDFRVNDTIRHSILLKDFYAYDDGTAEYGASLGKPSAQVAYRFETKASDPFSIKAIQIHFPLFGNNSNQIVNLHIYNDNQGTPGRSLAYQTITVQRTPKSLFTTYSFEPPVSVPQTFYVGWEQVGATPIAVGLDKSSNSGNKMFANTQGTWIQNNTVEGNLMIRPVIGSGVNQTTGTPEQKRDLYPNPADAFIYIPTSARHVILYNMLGQPITPPFETLTDELTLVHVRHISDGLYTLWYDDGKPTVKKILIKH